MAAAVYVTVLRNTPLLLVFIFATFGLPKMDVQLPFFVKGTIALTLYTSAFVCEAVRSGINSVPVGQAEAARASGLTFTQTMTNIVLPQAMRAVVPPLASVMIALLKNTSVGAVFGLFEATARMRFFSNNNADDRTLIFLTFALGYVILVEAISFGAYSMERRWRVAR
jgi:glutamate transport system permease protein